MAKSAERWSTFRNGFAARGKNLARAAIVTLPTPQARWLLFAAAHRRLPHLRNPKTFNEKVNWRAAFDRRQLLVSASSKVDSKMLARQWAPEILVPNTIWHGAELDELANVTTSRRWVLKASHRSGCVLAGQPNELDPVRLKGETRGWLEEYGFKSHALWAYGQVRREYILEDWIEDLDSHPVGYKFFVFDGRIAMIQVDTGCSGEIRRNLYAADWTPLPYTYTHPRGAKTPPPPNFEIMCDAARNLGAEFDFIRVDLYNVAGRIYFAELGAYPEGGLSRWPRDLDRKIGAFWSLPARSSVAWRLRSATSH